MVSQKSIADQLRRIGFNQHAWGKAEVQELPNIILPDETIFECVNGSYEGGFALLVATDVRVLLVDKKPFNYLTVEDLRFDMINEIDYNHRAFGAYVDISTGNRDLKFRSYNQARLRKLITHVQHCMAQIKKQQFNNQEGQHQHLEQINDHLKAYLIAQHNHQENLSRRLQKAQKDDAFEELEAPKPSPKLSDYLLAQGLLEEYKAKILAEKPKVVNAVEADVVNVPEEDVAADMPPAETPKLPEEPDHDPQDDLYAEGVREIFGTNSHAAAAPPKVPHHPHIHAFTFDLNPLKIASSKLPLAMRNRKFGRPSLHAHSQAEA
ncbi:MAG TPA: PH domain-containing protein, partial [Candidatus Saccharimonadales bacterium]|nr:PH domain-containing protein [Candidatus Saccharimonadales bacterium]